MSWFDEYEDRERERIFRHLQKAKPGTEEYKRLQTLLGGYEIIDEKRRGGRIQPVDWLRFGGTLAVTVLTVGADHYLPAIGGKLKIGEYAMRLFK